MSGLKVETQDQYGSRSSLEAALEELRERLGAERWVLCRVDDGEWGTQSTDGLPRDHVYSALVPQLEALGAGWHPLDPSDLGDAGLRLRIAGVASVAVLSSSLRGASAFAIFENPASAIVPDAEAPEDLTHIYKGTEADAREDDRWDHEMQWLWEMLPARGAFGGGKTDEAEAVQRLGESLAARAVVALVPKPNGIGVVAWAAGHDPSAEHALLEGDEWDTATAEPSVTLRRALEEVTGIEVVGSWAVSWAAGSRMLLGVVPGGRRPSQEGLDVASTLVGGAFGESQGNKAAGRHALLQERSRIASAIHEGLTQVVTNVAIQLQVLERVLDNPEKAREMVRASREAVLTALEDLRGAIFELAPRMPDSGDLTGGIERYVNDFASQWGIDITCTIDGEERPVDPEIAALVFAFVQEGLTNVRKHASSADTLVEVSFGEGSIAVSVHDDGDGFEPEATPEGGYRKHQGLSLLRSRVWLMGGTIDIESSRTTGTTLRMEISA